MYTFVVSLIVGYVGWAAVPRGAQYLTIFQVIGATAWLAVSVVSRAAGWLLRRTAPPVEPERATARGAIEDEPGR